MKKVAVFIGALIFLYGSFNIVNYLSDYHSLAAYGKGFVWGNGILIAIGFAMVYFGLRKSNTR